jgi:hypothetical protein
LQRRFVSHGGLTPPALVLQCERPPAKKRFFRCTNAHPTKSGGRQPAVVRQTRLRRHQRDSSQDRREYVRRSPLPSCAAIPRGLTPPALVLRCARPPAKNDFFDAQTRIRPRAANVSPPCVGFALATATVYFRLSALVRHDRFPHHGGLTPPALVLQCERLPAKKRFFRCTNAGQTKSGERQPAVVCDTNVVR